MRVTFDLPLDDFAESLAFELRHDDLIDLICGTDLRIAEVDFTEELIKRLARSIRADMPEEDFSAFLGEISKGAAP